MFKKSNSRRNRKANNRRNARRQQRLTGIESLESKQLLTALHVNQFDAQPDDRGCGDFSNECNSIGNALRFASNGDDIVLRPGVYHENVVVGKSVDINSIGGRSTIRPEFGPVAITTGAGVSVGLRNLDLTGGLAGIDAVGTTHLELFDVRANDNAAHGIIFDGGQLDIHQGEFSRNDGDGVVLMSGDAYIVDTEIMDNGAHGLVGHGLGDVELDNPLFEGNTMTGAFFDQVDRLVATDVRAFGNLADGVVLNATSGTIDITRSWFNDNLGDGLIVEGSSDTVTLTNVTASGNGLNGLHVKETTGTTAIAGGVFEGNSRDGINLMNVTDVEINKAGGVSTNANENEGHGLAVTGSDNLTATGRFRRNAGDGIRLDDVATVTINDASLQANEAAGLHVNAAENVTVEDTTTTENLTNGIQIDEAHDVTIIGGSANANTMAGIQLGKVDDSTITGNVVLDGTQAAGNNSHGVVAQGTQSITIKGGSYSNNTNDGIHVDGAGNVDVQLHPQLAFTANDNGDDGLSVTDARDVTLTGEKNKVFEVDRNSGFGAVLEEVDDVAASNISASTNKAAGIYVLNAASFTDEQGSYISNETDGVRLREIVGNVRLVETSAIGNDSNADNVGDGLHAVDVGGNVNITDGRYEPNPFGNGQIHGMLLQDVDGNVLLDETAPSQLSASSNLADGVRITNVGTATGGGNVTVRGGNFDSNGAYGVQLLGTNGRLKNATLVGVVANDNTSSGVRVEDVDGNVTVQGTTALDNGLAGVQIVEMTKAVSVGGTIDIVGGEFSRRVGSVSTQARGIDLRSPGGNVSIDQTETLRNTADGIRVRDAVGNVAITNTTATQNTVHGLAINGAEKDLLISTSVASNNGVDGINVRNMAPNGLATDFKVTIDESVVNANGSDGIDIGNVERVLVEDSMANDNNSTGLLFSIVTDDVTVRRSEANENATGILLDEANDVNLQFTDAKDNIANGLLSFDGSTLHATGGSYSNNGASGWDVNRSGDVSTFASTFGSNANDGLSLDDAGAVNLSATTFAGNQQHGFSVANAASITVSSLEHVGNLLHSTVTGTPTMHFLATAGDLETQDDITLSTVENGWVSLDHTRTVMDQDDQTTDSIQDTINILGVAGARLSGGDGADQFTAMNWAEGDATGLAVLELFGNDHADQFDVAFSAETEVRVEGDTPEAAPGDRLTLHRTDLAFTDDGTTLSSSELQDIHYAGIEHVDTSTSDTTAPTVELLDVDSGLANEVTIRFSEPVTGLDLADLQLTRNGESLDLANATLRSTDNGTTWVVGNLRDLTRRSGSYQLRLTAVDSAIEDLFGNELTEGNSTDWTHTPGDANGDGLFDSGDLIAAFAAGKYELNRPATYAEGDWNNDGVFDSSDLIHVFSHGDYRR